MNKYITMSGTGSHNYNTWSRGNPNSFIGMTTTRDSAFYCGDRCCGRGRGRGQGRGHNGCGGQGGRESIYNNQHSGGGTTFGNNSSQSQFAPVYGNFVPEAKVYPPNIYQNLTHHQHQSIDQLKQQQGWINSTTPPPGFTIDQNKGTAIPSNAIVSAICTASINQFNVAPPPPNNGLPSIIQVPPPPSDNNNNNPPSNQAGSSFSRQGNHRQSDSTSIGMVSINGQNYGRHIYDSYGNPLNWLTCQLYYLFVHFYSWLASIIFKLHITYGRKIYSLYSILGCTKSQFDIDHFCHPVLTNKEMTIGCRLGFDSWADTSCSGKHAYVESFVDGQSVTASGFSSTLGKLENLPIANKINKNSLISNLNATAYRL
jgi:hypothetical protein